MTWIRFHNWGLSFTAVLIALLSASIAPMPVAAQRTNKVPTAQDAINAIENHLLSPVEIVNQPPPDRRLVEEMEKNHVPGVSIAVVHGGKIQWAKAYGVMPPSGPNVTTETLFQAASISKSVSAMAALTLVARGKLALDSPINAELKSWSLPENEFTAQHPVTLHELLSGTGGTSVIGFASYPRGDSLPTLKQILDGVPPANSGAVRVVITPGTEFRYSGGGFEIVQQAMEDASGEPFEALVRKAVLDPSGMHQSNFEQPISSSLLANAAYPVDSHGNWMVAGPPTLPELAAGGLWTTPSDIARWIIDLQKSLSGEAGHVLSPALARLMVTPVKNGYGLGIEVKMVDGRLSFEHTGSNSGYQSMYVGDETGDGAVVMTNSDNGFAVIAEIIPTLGKVYGWPAYAPEKRFLANVALAQQLSYVGEFTTEDGYKFEIVSGGARLQFSGLAHSGSTLFPSAPQSFFVTDNTMQITFDGPDRGVMEIGGGKKVIFTRASSAMRPVVTFDIKLRDQLS
jgi:CubicO group peptidase (beta-lactamase class C family)